MRSLLSFVGSALIAVHRLRRRRHRRRAWQMAFVGAALTGAMITARATSVAPPTFPQLVAESDVIIRGTVDDVTSRWVDGPQGRVIKTFVTVTVDKRLKGDPPNPLRLEFLGGTVGSDSLNVAGMPQFTVGRTEILFIHGNGVQFCPLVRMMHGRYRVRTDATTQRRYVARDDRMPVTSTSDVGRPEGATARRSARTAAAALSPEAFEAAIANEVTHPTR
ncbi:MAG TPA: hypothetical protein VHE61_24555 [Opitutaceae bacterium]|nr:hypothetical protein [Opitutaceae bacterium]